MSAKTASSGGRTTRGTPRSQPTRPVAAISAARAAAFEILSLVDQGTQHSDDLLHSARTAALSPEDRNLATALVMGTLRWQIALDAQITAHLARPEQRLAAPVALALRLGAFQLLHMDRIPAHAAINESVELCRAAGQVHAGGMVNAVLRRIAEQADNPGNVASDPRYSSRESLAAVAERLGHPLWLVERWAAAYGREAALAICAYDQHEPAPGSLFSPSLSDGARASDSLPHNAAAPAKSPLQIDDGSRLIAELAAAAHTGDRAPRVWDCCAAPGGKTLVLAERLPEAQILATDISAKRLARTASRMARSAYAARIRCEVMDAAEPAGGAAERGFDLILCDVPCSGTGTLARNPEIRHRLRLEDLERQAARQRAILLGALSQLAPGGRLLYSTCSLEPEENGRVVESVLAQQAEGQRAPIEPLLASLEAAQILRAHTGLERTAVRDGALRTLPGVHPFDGFYAALLERN